MDQVTKISQKQDTLSLAKHGLSYTNFLANTKRGEDWEYSLQWIQFLPKKQGTYERYSQLKSSHSIYIGNDGVNNKLVG